MLVRFSDSTRMATINHRQFVRKELLKYGVASNMGLNEIIKDRIANGEKIYHMAFGQSPFPIYEKAVERLKEHAGENEYLPVAGIKQLRQAIVEFHQRVEGISGISPDDVIIGPGTKQLSFLLQEIFNGDVYMLSPCWTTYKPQSVLAHKEPCLLNTSYEKGWKLDPVELEQKFSENKDRNKLLIIINPDNPTGVAYTPEENQRITSVCRKHKALVLSDEIYSLFHFGNAHDSIFKHYPEGTILQNGLSKWASAGGWRLGYHIYPPNLSDLRDVIRSSASQTYSCASAPIQFGALEYFKYDGQCREYVAHCNRILGAVSKYVYRELTSVGVKIVPPKGGFYMMPDFEVIREPLEKRGITTGKELQDALLKECSVALMACGPAFLRPERELSFRLCFINFDGQKALEESRKIGLNSEITDEFLRTNCATTVEGIIALREWTMSQQH